MLTERESLILKFLVRGLKNEEISERLSISPHTTKAHLESIYHKLSVKNRVQAAVKTLVLGLVKLEDLSNDFSN